MAREQKWLVDHYDEVEQYTGKWVVILNNRVIAAGKTAKAALKRAKWYYLRNPEAIDNCCPFSQ